MEFDKNDLVTLVTIDTKLDGLVVTVTEIRDEQKLHANRISSLEKWRSWTAGVGAAVGGYLGFIK